MKTARTWAVALTGVDGHLVEVEADVSNQTPDFRIIGLGDRSLGEAVQRVRNACMNTQLDLPKRRLTVNLSPASLPKQGSGFDVAVAVAAIATGGALDAASLARTVHIGELGLDGRLRPIAGVLPAVLAAARAGFDTVVVPAANAEEAALVPGIRVRGAVTLAEVAQGHGADLAPIEVEPVRIAEAAPEASHGGDLSEVLGQPDAVEAVIVAAAGGHHLMMSGPPGAGKTLLAQRMPGVLPELGDAEALEVAAIRSLAGECVAGLDRTPPLQTPHHHASVAALVGGGSRIARPGAIVRAHRGILFLDEAAEFSRVALDALRQPLESGVIDVQRAGFTARFPARFQLVLATNPCPCGNYGVRHAECTCPPMAIRRYAARLSGPLRDRLDMELHLTRVARTTAGATTTTAQARERVVRARSAARERWQGSAWLLNSELPGAVLRSERFRPPQAVRAPLDRALELGALTLRGYDRVLRLAWTISDLAGHSSPTADDIGRALFLKRGVSA